MIEATFTVLFLVIIAESVLIAFMLRQSHTERSKFINAIIAKNSQDLASTDAADKMKVQVSVPQKQPGMIPEGDMTDEEFKEMIGKDQ